MHCLFLSNFYPPIDFGGWEQWCQEIADAFMARGHTVTVLTSRYRRDQVTQPEPHVHRALHLESDLNYYRPADFFFRLAARDQFNRNYLERLIAQTRPDVAMIWGMWQLNQQLAMLIEQRLSHRVAYYFCGFWPVSQLEHDPHTAYWQRYRVPLGWLALRRLAATRRIQLALTHTACVSRFVLENFAQAGRPLPAGRVIYGGTDLRQFRPVPRALERRSGPGADLPLRLLFAGSVSREKGVDTVLQAMALLAPHVSPRAVQVSIVGSGHPDLVQAMHDFVQQNGLAEHVHFRGRVGKDQMPTVLQAHDVLLFSSAWEEPLARMMMEGMASGLVLVSTTTGGSKEILQHGHNCLTFEAGDAQGLACQVQRLLSEPDLAAKLATAGRHTAETQLDFQRMADELEAFCAELLPDGLPWPTNDHEAQ